MTFFMGRQERGELREANESLFVGFHGFASHGECNIRYLPSNADH